MTSDLKKRFDLDGYAFPFRAFTAKKARQGEQIVERLEQKGAGRLGYFLRAKPHLLIPWFWDLVHAPEVLQPIQELLGDNVLCYGSSFIDKRPGDERYVAWHQDVTYWGLSDNRAVTAWIALTPSQPDSGCVRILPGTHTSLLPHTDSNDFRNMLGRGEKLAANVDENLAVDLTLRPGEFSLHDGLIIHGSRVNLANHRRLGFVARYIPASTSMLADLKGFATLVAGCNLGNIDLEQAPEAEMGNAAIQRHRTIFRSSMTTIMRGKLKNTKL